MYIDSHQHFWKYSPQKHSWINDEMTVIRKDFTPDDLKLVFDQNGIDGCVAVQADQSLEETNYLINLADHYNFIKGIVGWVDFRAPNLTDTLSHYSHYKKVKGFRHVVQDEKDHNFLLRKDFLAGVSQLKTYNYTYDILVFPHQLGAVLEFVKKFPDQKFVIDHIAKPYIKDGFYDGWAVLMQEIAKYDHVYCKLSGMVTEADYTSWTYEQFNPYMDFVLNSFGSHRIMFGSDWPVCLVAANYAQMKKIVDKFIIPLSKDEKTAIMGKNASKFYNLT